MQKAPREISTNRLTLRPPAGSDLDLWRGLSEAPGRDSVVWGDLRECVARWERDGFGFGVVEEASTRSGIGIGGLRHEAETGTITLACRLDDRVRGRGLGTEAARAWTVHAVEWLPALPVLAQVPGHDARSLRIARAAGLEHSGGQSDVLVVPRVESPTRLDDATRDSMLDLWCAVNDSGGAVGFLPDAPRADVDAALASHEEAMAQGSTTAVLLRAPAGDVLAMGFWVAGPNPLLSHTRTAYRVMTDPRRRGRNLGRLLMAAMHRVAREQGVEVAVLDVRSGLGTTRFYEGCGYVEVGRVPGVIRVAPGDDRDSVVMARRLDGRPMVADGRA